MPGWISRAHFVTIVLLFLCVHAAMFSIYGIRMLHDAIGFVISADELINEGALVRGHNFFYSLHVIIIAGFLVVFNHNIIPFLIFQCAISLVAVLYLYRAAKVLTNETAALIVGLIFIFWWDNIQWNSTNMTESLFLSVSCFLIYRLTIFAGRKRDFVYVLGWVLISLLFRPTGIVLVLSVVVFFLSLYWVRIGVGYSMIIPISIVLLTVTVICAYYLLNIWDFSDQYIRGNVVTYVDGVEDRFNTTGLRVIPQNTAYRDNYDLPVMKIIMFVYYNPLEFFYAGVLKVIYLLTYYRPYYSNIHNIYVLIWNGLVYAAFITGFKKIHHASLRYFVISAIVLNCLLIGVSSVDWDNRFYIPMEAGIVLVAGVGFYQWLLRLRVLRS